jgi:hypothetical protein
MEGGVRPPAGLFNAADLLQTARFQGEEEVHGQD